MWDPLSVGGLNHGWPADEYDDYLLQAALELWHGGTDEAVTDYLIIIETEYMGLTVVPGLHARAMGVVQALREYVGTLRS